MIVLKLTESYLWPYQGGKKVFVHIHMVGANGRDNTRNVSRIIYLVGG